MIKDLKTFIATVFIATGTWIIVLNLRENILLNLPAGNQYIVAMIIIIFGGYLANK